jgi:predicted SAM-dependent methyltransferase
MKRVREFLGKESRRYLIDAFARRKSYYLARFQGVLKRKGVIESYLKFTERKRLHLGCGGNLLEGWLNSDILDVENDMIFIDVRDKLPFDNDTFDFVYSEHLLEHLSYDEGEGMLEECLRILKRGGVCRMSTPDLGFLIEFYANDTVENSEYLEWASEFYWQFPTYSKALVVNHYFRSWGHKSIWDFQLLRDSCERLGFRKVTQEDVGKSAFRELRDIERHGVVISEKWNIKESLIIEAEK